MSSASSSASMDVSMSQEEKADDVSDALSLLNEFRTLSSADTLTAANKTKCKSLLTKLKLALTKFQLVPPFTNHIDVTRGQLVIARETLELAALFSLKDEDVTAFERHVVQLKTYYNDYAKLLPESERKWSMLGLYLLCLLVLNRLGDFHTELELIPLADRTKNKFIKYSVELEEHLMEGSYNKVFAARNAVPSPHYSFFVAQLVQTVRDKIAECSEGAYDHFPLADARATLMFTQDEELADYCEKRGWSIKNGVVYFNRSKDRLLELGSLPLIEQTLSYATELERIV